MLALADIRIAVAPYFQKLADLPTAEAIRDFLVNEGIQAVKMDGTSCAIARYVSDSSGQEVHVGREEILVAHPDGDVMVLVHNPGGTDFIKHTRAVLHENTSAMHDFIRHFDSGEYPELEA